MSFHNEIAKSSVEKIVASIRGSSLVLVWNELSPEDQQEFIESWKNVILSELVPRTVICPDKNCQDPRCPKLIELYLTRYPDLRGYIKEMEAYFLSLFPSAKIWMELHQDPESCSICGDTQYLVFHASLPVETYQEAMAITDQFYQQREDLRDPIPWIIIQAYPENDEGREAR